jgi:predicted AlkP superfamily phosphohydrolase/phosphomutase
VARVLLIGLDGFGYDFTARVFAAGFMPFLADRAAAGAFGPAASTIPPVSTAAWTTATTGVGIGKHGIVDFRRREMADYGFARAGRLINADDVRAPRVYEMAGDAGLSSFVLNLPVTYPAAPVNGVIVTGVLTPPGSDRGYWPPAFGEHLADYSYDLDAPVPDELPALCRRLEELAAGRARVAAAAFARERFDLAIVIFTGPDRLFHRFYREAYGWEDPADVPAAASAYLRALDGACEKVFESFGADATLVACSDHGFGAGPSQAFYVNRLLKRAGLLFAGGGPGPYALNVILEGARKFFGRGRPLAVDWRRTTAYGFPLYMRWGGVALNVAGEQPEGKVSPAEAPAAAEEVKRALSACAAGGPGLVEWVKTREEIYAGPAAADLPHLVFQGRAGVVVTEGKGPGPLVGSYRNPAKKGEHAVEAMALVAGADAPRGVNLDMKLEDVAATVAYVLGLDWRAMDGQPWGRGGPG